MSFFKIYILFFCIEKLTKKLYNMHDYILLKGEVDMCEKKGYKSIIKVVIFSLLVLLYIIALYEVKLQNDTFFDIKLGEKYLSEGIVKEDSFSIHEDMSYIAQHLGVNIITYLVYSNFGYNGLYILGILLTSLIAVLFYRLNINFLKRKKLAYVFVFIELYFMQSFLSIRAQMYSYIIFLIEILIIEKFIKSKKKLYLIVLSVMPMILINLHAGVVPFYFIILGVYFLNILRIKISKIEYDEEARKVSLYLLIPIFIGMALLFINPFGIDAITYGFKTLSNNFINNYISEFQPFSLKNSCGVIIAIYAAIFIFTFIFTKKKIKIHHFLLLFGTMFMTLVSLRHFSLFIICSITCLAYIESLIDELMNYIFFDMQEKGKELVRGVFIFVITIVLIRTAIATSANNDNTSFLPEDTYPLEAIEYINNNIGKDKRIFNEYTWGSLMMCEDIKVFIDSRADLYTKEYSGKENDIGLDYIKINNCSGNYIKLLEKYDIEYLFIRKSSNLAKNILEHEEYKMVYQDDISCIIKKVN